MTQAIKRAVLQSFDNTTYTASVLLLEATSTFLTVAVDNTVDNTSAIPGALCAVLFFDEHNPNDAVVIAIYGNVGYYFPNDPTPAGTINFVPGFRQINGSSINSGVTSTFQISGVGGIPAGASAILYKAYFTSSTVGAYMTICPHNPNDQNAYGALGNMPVAGGVLNGNALIPLDSTGNIDITANNGNCQIWLYTYGYVL